MARTRGWKGPNMSHRDMTHTGALTRSWWRGCLQKVIYQVRPVNIPACRVVWGIVSRGRVLFNGKISGGLTSPQWEARLVRVWAAWTGPGEVHKEKTRGHTARGDGSGVDLGGRVRRSGGKYVQSILYALRWAPSPSKPSQQPCTFDCIVCI